MAEISVDEIHDFKIGQAQNIEAATGCTVIICDKGAVCGVDVRGGSPGTRDTDALNPVNNREKVHAVLLSGGSSFGLDAAGGAMKYLEEKKIGRDVAVTVVPNVCAAILFDLRCGSSDIRPDVDMGYAACENAFSPTAWKSGNYGAGTGATVGKFGGIKYAMKGGVGSSVLSHDELYVGAIVAVNCAGDIYDSKVGKIIAGTRTANGKGFADSEQLVLDQYNQASDLFSGNTVIGCIITNARLTKSQATKLASMGHNGIARAVRPAHTIFDGDTIFSMCTGDIDATLTSVGILAGRAIENAIIDAVKSAESYDGLPAMRDY
jgi:L-aminopeptidase/D-esterase